MDKKYQARAPETQPFDRTAFDASGGTTLRWLGMAGFLINGRGTTIMIDPLLEGFDMPIMIDMPIAAADVPRVDAILVTHSDNDHYSVPTCPGHGHAIGDTVDIGPVRVELTPADHAWQNASPGASDRVFQPEDACGFWIDTPDGTIWAPGDSRLIPDHHLHMPSPDALLFDFSDSEWHFGLEGAARMANAYPTTPLLLHHWGCVDAPDFAPFNGDPDSLPELVENPERIRVLAPGEPFELSRLP